MKKTTLILLLVIQVALLFIFHNIYLLMQEYEEMGTPNHMQWQENTRRLKNIFSTLSIITSILLLGTGGYLVYVYRKSHHGGPEADGMPPMQDYLLQLKSSEIRLKEMVDTQQEKVAEKEELNKSIINNMDAAIIFLNPGGRIEIFNHVAEKMFAQSYAHARNNVPDKILSKFPEILTYIDEHEEDQKSVTEEIQSGEQVFWVHLNPIDNVGVLILVRDMTEEKKRDEIDRRNSNFIMLGEMTAFLAHEIRNSLGVIYGYTRTMKGDETKTGKVNKEIQFLTKMMETFLNFSKPVTVNTSEWIDLVPLLKTTAAETDIPLIIPEEEIFLDSDPSLLRSIFSNLILNAREAGATAIDISFRTEEGLEIFLKDNGKGIDEKNREKIWFPFFTTKDKGTGMGLAVIRKIINSLEGEISLEKSSDKGTTFKISFLD